ncbi:MAG TPA: choice-of-anchor B family protein, partial [Anaerolineales bacterium]|nr:choice-of-anchor B family protein [Anaerolineales bacterium]
MTEQNLSRDRSRLFLLLLTIIPLAILLLALSTAGRISAAGADGSLPLGPTPTPTTPPAEGMPPTACENGFAGPFPCDDVDFVSFLSNTDLGAGAGQTGANLWGWTDPLTGKEYVLMALTDSTAFVDISDPENPVVIGTLPTQTIPSNAYRDVKVYQDHAFIIADQNSLHGMQ